MPYAASDRADRALYTPGRAVTPTTFVGRAGGAVPQGRVALVPCLLRSRARLQAAVRRVSSDGWTGRAGEGRWTASEILEHLALTEWAVIEFVRGTLLTLPARDRAARVPEDAQVLRVAADRGVRLEAPERLRPLGRWSRPAALCASVDAARDAALALVGAAGDALRERAAPHPQLGLLDGAQWLLFLAGHTERHAAQLDALTPARAAAPAAA